MASTDLLNVHPILFDRVRLSLMAHLSFVEAAVDFNSLRQSLVLTKVNLSTHLKTLEEE